MSLHSTLLRRTLLTLALVSLPAIASADVGNSPEQDQSASTSAAPSDGWDWTVTPYLWASSVSTNIGDGSPPAGSDTAFTDIVSKLEGAFLIHVEGQGDRFGVFGDVTYLSLGDEATHARAKSESSLDMSIVELAAVWNVDPGRYEGLDLFAGIRYLGTEADIKITPNNPAIPTFEPSLDVGLTDFMAGARYNATFSERWGATLRLDASAGETEGTLNASALLRYRMTKGSWVLGYRYMDVELSEGDRTLDLTLHGPVVAFAFGF